MADFDWYEEGFSDAIQRIDDETLGIRLNVMVNCLNCNRKFIAAVFEEDFCCSEECYDELDRSGFWE